MPWGSSRGTARAEETLRQRQVGLMDTRLRVAAWALDGALATVGDDPHARPWTRSSR